MIDNNQHHPNHQQQPSCGCAGARRKDRIAAALLAVFLGAFGVHKFYLGQAGWGIVYLLFCWTIIPGLIAFIEFILFLFMSNSEFDAKYNRCC